MAVEFFNFFYERKTAREQLFLDPIGAMIDWSNFHFLAYRCYFESPLQTRRVSCRPHESGGVVGRGLLRFMFDQKGAPCPFIWKVRENISVLVNPATKCIYLRGPWCSWSRNPGCASGLAVPHASWSTFSHTAFCTFSSFISPPHVALSFSFVFVSLHKRRLSLCRVCRGGVWGVLCVCARAKHSTLMSSCPLNLLYAPCISRKWDKSSAANGKSLLIKTI